VFAGEIAAGVVAIVYKDKVFYCRPIVFSFISKTWLTERRHLQEKVNKIKKEILLAQGRA